MQIQIEPRALSPVTSSSPSKAAGPPHTLRIWGRARRNVHALMSAHACTPLALLKCACGATCLSLLVHMSRILIWSLVPCPKLPHKHTHTYACVRRPLAFPAVTASRNVAYLSPNNNLQPISSHTQYGDNPPLGKKRQHFYLFWWPRIGKVVIAPHGTPDMSPAGSVIGAEDSGLQPDGAVFSRSALLVTIS